MVITGLEQLQDMKSGLLKNTRVGILANQTAVTRKFISICDVVMSAGANIKALFGPEHGAWGDAAEGACVSDTKHHYLNIPIYSLYGSLSSPTDEMLAGIEVMLVDLQDIGARFYTYAHTMVDLMIACGIKGIPVWVLDRPNPITGLYIEGPLLDTGCKSGVGKFSIPIRHGLTIGELARLHTSKFGVDCELEVIQMSGWARDMWFDETGLPWVAPSPNMPTLETAILYPGTCLIEGTNVSEGRGTTRPFEYIGAPWIDSGKLSQHLEEWELPGVRFREISFIPWTGKYSGVRCSGTQIHVVDRLAFRPVLTGISLVSSLYQLQTEQFEFTSPGPEERYFFDLLVGTPEVRSAIQNGVSPQEIAYTWQNDLETYTNNIASAKLYLS